MARLPRLSVGGYAHHVIQRGNNGQAIVRDDDDRARLLALWRDHANTWGVAIHAYVLLENHFHLLLTPSTHEALPKMMQGIGRSYVRYFNQKHANTGSLWEGRYRSSVLEGERYVLPCMVYLDLHPVRQGFTSQAADFAWSSHSHYVGRANQAFLTPHPLLWALGNTPFAREAAYAQQVQAGLNPADYAALTHAARSGWALGSELFLHTLQQNTARRLQARKAGRPFKKSVA